MRHEECIFMSLNFNYWHGGHQSKAKEFTFSYSYTKNERKR
jgi:hypothetical protein